MKKKNGQNNAPGNLRGKILGSVITLLLIGAGALSGKDVSLLPVPEATMQTETPAAVTEAAQESAPAAKEASASLAETEEQAPETATAEEQAPEEPETTADEASTETAPETTYRFRNKKLLSQHFEKHGSEFPYETKEEYEAGASAVVNSPDALHKLEAEDGDDVYYLEATNEFVIVSTDGYIRTYFKPNGGISYFNRQ